MAITAPVIVTFTGTAPPWSLTSLDANFANISTGIANANNYSNYLVDTGAVNAYVVSFGAGISVSLAAGLLVQFKTTNANTAAATLNVSATGVKSIVRQNGAALQAGDISTGINVVQYDGTNYVLQSPYNPSSSSVYSPIRQTVISGPVDSAGLPNFGGATGGTTVTMSGILIASAANGFSASNGGVDALSTITNAAWTGLSTNGTMYLYLDCTSSTATTGSVTLAPTYQWGGTFSTTNNQHTFNIQAMQMQVGNGATAAQTYRVFVGEVTVAGGVVTAITWYALMGRYQSAFTSTLPGAATLLTFNHNLGVYPDTIWFQIKNLTTEYGFAVGDIVRINYGSPGAGAALVYPLTFNTKSIKIKTMNSSSFVSGERLDTGDSGANLTAGNWAYGASCNRGW